MSPNVPPPKPSREKHERKHARLSVMMRVREREREMGGGDGGWWMAVAEDADVQRGGEGRHDGRKYNNLLFGEDGN